MGIFLQFITGGLFFGGMYTLIALGIVTIYKSTRVFNLAQGWMVTLSAFMLLTLVQLLGVIGGVIAGLAFGALLGFGIDRLLMRPLIGQPLVAPFLLTIMLAYIFEGINILVWGSMSYEMPIKLPGEPLRLGGVVVGHSLLWGIVAAVLAFTAFSMFYWRTLMGRVMRATAEDHQTAQSLGLPVKGVFSLSWMLAGMLSVIGGLFLGVVSGVNMLMYQSLLGAISVVLLGGLDSIAGAIVGGMILGLIQSLVVGYLSPSLADVIPYIILLGILIIKPYGLFGLVRIERL